MGTTHAKQNYIAMRSYTRSARRAGDQAHLPDILTLRHSIEYQLIIRIWRLENFKIPADNDIHMLTGIASRKRISPERKLTNSSCARIRSSSSIGKSVKKGMRASKFVVVITDISIVHESIYF